MKSNDTKLHIVNTLINQMTTKNLNDIFVKDIAVASNITRQTFYRHFKDKYDVINWFYDEKVETLFTDTNTLKGIHDNLVKKCDFYKEYSHVLKNAYRYKGQNSLADHEFYRIFNSLSKKIYENTNTPIDNQSVEFKFALEFFCHGVVQTTIDWLNNGALIPSEKTADMLLDLMPKEVKFEIENKC
ncbi:TetR/AcrR family transcriptional regulator C-terminal domain-containing protein [Clostridium sp. DL1XJH146]